MNTIVTILAPLLSLIIFLLGFYFNKLKEKTVTNKELNRTYLNGLRLYLEESYYRLFEIQEAVIREKNCKPLLFIDNSGELLKKDKYWFASEGCYLISTSYFVACLFGAIEKLRQLYPYIKTKKADDTAILNKIFKINLAFSKDLNVYYVLQHNIGQIMYRKPEDRLLNYSEYVGLLNDENSLVWFSRLIDFLIHVGKGEKKQNLESAIQSIYSLSIYLENKYRLGPSIKERIKAEKDK